MKLRLLFKDGRREERTISWLFTSKNGDSEIQWLNFGTDSQELGCGTSIRLEDIKAWDVQRIPKGCGDLKL